LNLVCVDPAKVHLFWPEARPLILAATERCGDVPVEEIEGDLRDGLALLWLATDHQEIHCALVTQLLTGIDGKRCQLVAIGGHGHRHWLHLIEKIESYAKSEGCDAMRFSGRYGWARLLPDYEEIWVTMEKKLENEHAR
jgi:hypothetical protein